MEANAFAPRVSSSLYADDSMLVDHFSVNDNTRHVPTVVKHAEATSESDDVQDNMSIGSFDYPDLEPELFDSPDQRYWPTHEHGQVDFMVGDPSVSSSSRQQQQQQQHHPSSTSKTTRRQQSTHHSKSTPLKRRVNSSSSEKNSETQKTSNNKKEKHVIQPDSTVMEEEEDDPFYEIEDIVGHKVYRSQAVMYEIKWKGYDSKQNTWEIASHIHEDCPQLCIDYWNKQENTPIPKNVPRQKQQQKQQSSHNTRSYIERLQKYNIDNNSLVPYYRKQGYRLSYDLDFPTPSTDWKKELRVIHFVQRVKSTDQILAYVSWMNKKKTVHVIQELHDKCPDMLINYYESCLTFAGS